MEKDKSPNPSTGFLPPSGRYSVFTPSSDSNDRFSHDISRMPDNPPKQRSGHRRAHSEILSLPDDISFDSDLGIVGDGPSFSEENEEDLLSMYLDMDKFSSSMATSAPSSSSALIRVRHQHNQSMDGSTTFKPEMLMAGTEEEASGAEAKKAMSAAKLAELALIDPKRAKRTWANRQSAARSKERKTRYIAELERKVQTLQTEATSLSAQLTLLQRDTHGLTAENSELKLRLQTMEQQVHLQDALNEALKEEIHHLKLVTGQAAVGVPNGGHMITNIQQQHRQLFYGNNNSDSNSNNHHQSASTMHTLLAAQQFQQLQIHSQKHHHQQLQQQQLHHHFQQQQEDQQRSQLRGGGSVSSSSSHKDNIINNHNKSSA